MIVNTLWNAFVGDSTDSTTKAAGAVAFANAAVRMRKGATGSFNLDTTDQAGAALDIQVDQNSDGSTDPQTTRTDNLSNDVTARMTSDEASDDDVDQTP